MNDHLRAALAAFLLLSAGCNAPVEAGHEDHDDHGEEGHDDHGEEDHDDHDDHGEEDDEDHGDEDHDDHGEAEADDDDHAGHDDHGDEPEEGVVMLSEVAMQRSGIVVGQAGAGAITSGLSVPAEVQLNPDRIAHISSLVEGQLLNVNATIGDQVTVDQELAELRSVTLGQARADLRRARAMQTAANQNLERQERLRSEGISSERSLLEAQLVYDEASAERDAASSRLQVFGLSGGSGPDMTLSSPIDGVVIERHATRGENVSPENTIFVIADLSRVWVIGRVYDQQIGRIRPGMTAVLTLDAYPSRTFEGTVDFVGATLDEATRTLPIRVELENPDGVLRPGLFGALRLSDGDEARDVVRIPSGAVLNMDGLDVVFVPSGAPGEFHRVEVTLGATAGGVVEVIEGLEAGDSVVVEGGFVLKSELMRSELGHGHAH